MSVVNLENPTKNPALTEQKAKQLQKVFHSFKNEVVEQEKEIAGNESKKLQNFLDNIHQFKEKLTKIRSECQIKHTKLCHDIEKAQKKLQGFMTAEDSLKRQEKLKNDNHNEKRNFKNICEQRIKTAESIDYKNLKKIEIDERKSPANEVFKWIMVAMYVEPESKYYWPNFKSQVIENKEALEDLKERLGKINAFTAKEEQKVITVRFLEAEAKIKESPQFKGFEKEIDRIFEVAKHFQQGINIGRRIKANDKEADQIEKMRANSSEQNEQLRRQCNALTEKKKLEELYLNQLKLVEIALDKKSKSYQKEIEQAQQYISQLTSTTSEILLDEAVKKENKEVREHCECNIF